MNKALLPLLIAAGLSACATPQTRLQTGLRDAGLSQRQSACMADRMADKLSLGQLLKLRSLSNFKDKKAGDMRMKEFLRNIRSLQDPEILAITTRAALGCAIDG